MKAVLLGGGHGTRAKPFTDYFPKAMIPIAGRPVIDHVVRWLAKFSQISDLIILCEFDNMGKQIINYFEGKEAIVGKPLTFVENKKQGTGGALLKIEGEVGADEHFLTWFADNLCAISIDDLIREYNDAYKTTNGRITALIAVRKQRVEETGRVILDNSEDFLQNKNDKDSKKTFLTKRFIEKGVIKLEQPEAIGIYLFNNIIFEYLHRTSDMQGGTFDLSHDILEHIGTIGGELYSYILDEDTGWLDIESPSYADRHKDIVEKILLQMRIAAIQRS